MFFIKLMLTVNVINFWVIFLFCFIRKNHIESFFPFKLLAGLNLIMLIILLSLQRNYTSNSKPTVIALYMLYYLPSVFCFILALFILLNII